MEYTAMEIAKYVVTYCYKMGNPITNLQLQKILYYVQGYSYAYRDKEAFSDEIVAWQYGPVVESVYKHFSSFAAFHIEYEFDIDISDKKLKDLIKIVICNKLKYPVWELVEQTHNESPWKFTTEIYGLGSTIPKEFIKMFFKENN